MLEYNFGELDNDFITLWSKFVLSHDLQLIKNDIEKLAELGQVNAVQSYFLMVNDLDTLNKNICNIVDKYSIDDNFNYIFAKANRAKLNERDEIKRLCLERDNWESLEDLYQIKRQINNLDYCKLLRMTMAAAKSQYEITLNPLIMERVAEMGYSWFNVKKHIKIALKQLIKLYQEKPNDPQVQFALAKNIVLFGNSKKQNDMATKILTQLAERPLSETLKNYTLQGSVIKKQ